MGSHSFETQTMHRLVATARGGCNARLFTCSCWHRPAVRCVNSILSSRCKAFSGDPQGSGLKRGGGGGVSA